MNVKRVWNKIFEFKIGDKVRMVRTSFRKLENLLYIEGEITAIFESESRMPLVIASEGKKFSANKVYEIYFESIKGGKRIWVLGDWLERI